MVINKSNISFQGQSINSTWHVKISSGGTVHNYLIIVEVEIRNKEISSQIKNEMNLRGCLFYRLGNRDISSL
jgi:hypothetical protein